MRTFRRGGSHSDCFPTEYSPNAGLSAPHALSARRENGARQIFRRRKKPKTPRAYPWHKKLFPQSFSVPRCPKRQTRAKRVFSKGTESVNPPSNPKSFPQTNAQPIEPNRIRRKPFRKKSLQGKRRPFQPKRSLPKKRAQTPTGQNPRCRSSLRHSRHSARAPFCRKAASYRKPEPLFLPVLPSRPFRNAFLQALFPKRHFLRRFLFHISIILKNSFY